MTHQQERDSEAAHAKAMLTIENVVVDWKRGVVSFNTAKSLIDDALIGDSDRIVKIGKPHTPEIET
jgi:hypothetical protein